MLDVPSMEGLGAAARMALPEPTWYSASILTPLLPVPLCKPWLLTEDNPQVKRDHHDDGIDIEPRQRERHSPAQQNERDCHVHWIARVAIQADDNELLRWGPRGQSAFATDIEVSHAPQEARRADEQETQAKRVRKWSVRNEDPDARDCECDDAWQCEECDESLGEHAAPNV
jgi:hypothetical protein